MNKILDKFRAFGRRAAAGTAVTVIAGAGALGLSGTAGATTPSIEDTFASTQASLLTELGYGVALVVALLLVGLGVRMIIKWSKKGVASS